MRNKKRPENDRRWWVRLLSSHPEEIEIRTAIREWPKDRTFGTRLTHADVPPRERDVRWLLLGE